MRKQRYFLSAMENVHKAHRYSIPYPYNNNKKPITKLVENLLCRAHALKRLRVAILPMIHTKSILPNVNYSFIARLLRLSTILFLSHLVEFDLP